MTLTKSRKSAADRRYQIPSLQRALRMLEWMTLQERPVGVTETAAALRLPKNSVFRIATTLANEGYLNRDELSKTYHASPKLLLLGYRAVSGEGLAEKSLDAMRTLRDATGETVLIGMLSENSGVVLEQVLSTQAVKVHVEIGHRFPLHTAAPAKAMLAFLPMERCQQLIATINFTRFTDTTITTARAYSAELATVQRQGFALDRGEEMSDLACVAAPIFDRRGEVRSSIWITGPASRLSQRKCRQMASHVVAAAEEISRRLGYARPAL